jgi:hypothetical protein
MSHNRNTTAFRPLEKPPAARSRAPFAAMPRLKKVAWKLSQRFRDAKAGGMMAHGNLKCMP